MRYINRLKEEFNSFSIFLKISLLFETVLITSLLAVALFLIVQFSEMLREKEIALGETKIEKLSLDITDKYNRIYSLSNYMTSGEISQIMRKINSDDANAFDYKNINYIDVFFKGVIAADNSISDIILVSSTGNVFSFTTKASYEVKTNYAFMQDDQIKEFMDTNENMKIYYSDPSTYSLRKRVPVISFMGKIYDASLFPSKHVVGIYIINIPIEEIDKSVLLKEENSKGELFLVSSTGQILYSTTGRNTGEPFSEESMNVPDIYHKSRKVGISGLTVRYSLTNKELFYEIDLTKRKIAIVLCISIGITLLISFLIYRIFNKKVILLLDSMKKVQKGNFQLKIPVNTQDEIGMLSKSFNEMCVKLNEYIARVYRAEIQQKNAEINALQVQIDPHFLYNTLESIKAKAIEEGSEVTSEMITLLGNLFRWSMRTKEKIVVLEEEIEYVKTYLKIQSYRFSKRLEVDIHISEEYLDYGIPKLILQPLVENVIKHGIDPVIERGIIGIHAKQKDSNLEITIFDNGKGISEIQLECINNKLINTSMQDEFESIGIQNVHQRLKLLFGDEYGIQIKSIVNYGTAVKVTVPAMAKKEMEIIV
ncbi:sensor histidine kinase [uncultured Robinsoniella sp.]|uniref:sensor histidine kinase n=1 Tax=uncultured Robinsoniella sp. TaxID=904190 RepID=UPI00374EDF01